MILTRGFLAAVGGLQYGSGVRLMVGLQLARGDPDVLMGTLWLSSAVIRKVVDVHPEGYLLQRMVREQRGRAVVAGGLERYRSAVAMALADMD